jgi:pimeloyl-ACP methyl ester carboxylesterase
MHCSFSAAEEIVALRTLFERIDSGRWPDTTPARLSEEARELGDRYDLVLDFGTFQDAPVAPGVHGVRAAAVPAALALARRSHRTSRAGCRPHAPGRRGRSLRRMYSVFTPSHRGGSGSPLVCLHGFTGTWRTWELVLPALERRHDVLAPTLPGHAGGAPLDGDVSVALVVDAVERAMDDADFETAHIVGNSLGGYVALQLAARGRAASVVALAPAGGWATGDESYKETARFFTTMQDQLKAAAPHVDAIVASAAGRRQATQLVTTNFEHIPADLVAHHICGVASCGGARAMIEYAIREGYDLDAERIACPVRIVWGTDDRLLPWPATAARFRDDWLPHADWVELDGIGHCPQLDVPLETAQLILGFTAR